MSMDLSKVTPMEYFLYKPMRTDRIQVEGTTIYKVGYPVQGKMRKLERWVGKVLTVSKITKEDFDRIIAKVAEIKNPDKKVMIQDPTPVVTPALEPVAETKTSAAVETVTVDTTSSEVEESTDELPTTDYLSTISMGDLREYAGKFGVSGRSRDKIISTLVEMGKAVELKK